MDIKPNSNKTLYVSMRSYRVATGGLLLLIVYGSLYPLTWNFSEPQDFVFKGPIGIVDFVENVVLFLPLGWVLAWRYQGEQRKWFAFGIWFLIALVVASVLQWLQKYLPRTPALSDIVFNMIGHVAGWWAGLVSVHGLHRLQQRHRNLSSADRFALLMVAIWLVAELFPLIPTIDVSSVANNVKSLWQQVAWQPRRMVLHIGMTVIGLEALGHLVRTASTGSLARHYAGIATLMVLAGKFLVVGQSPGLPVVYGILGGALIWWGIDRIVERQRLTVILLAATCSYLLHAIWPLQWRDVPEPMRWLPFASSLSGSIESVVTSVAYECLCFGALIWSAVRMGASVRLMAVIAATLAFTCEWLQRYLPTRTAEITSVLLALCMAWLVSALGQTRRGETLSV